jgi:type VI protein secretion system component VasK
MNVFRTGFWNLTMACVWLVIGLLLFRNTSEGNNIHGTSISLGWPALAIAVYNVVRFWQRRSAWARIKEDEEAERKRQMKHVKDRERERNPDFIFEDEPTKTEPPA